MSYRIKRIIFIFTLLICIFFLIVIANQLLSMYYFLYNIGSIYAKIFIYALMALILITLTYIMFQFTKFSKQITLPKDENSQEYKTKIKKLAKSIKKNKQIKGDIDYGSKSETEWVLESIKESDEKAREVIKDNAKYVFLSTAVSQNGIFDSIIIFMAQIKMIWQILHIYYQRPNLKFVISLYVNIAITIFTVKAIEDFDYIEKQIEPLVASILGSSITPGINLMALLLINSLISGTANTFLILRIGIIAQNYSSPLINKRKKDIRKNAGVEASKLLGKVISSSIVLLTKSIGKASLNTTKRFGKGSKKKAKEFSYQSKEFTKNIIDSIKEKFN